MRRIFSHWHETPLHTGRKAGASAPAKIRPFHQFGDLCRRHEKRFAEALISFAAFIFREAYWLSVRSEVASQRFLHRTHLLVLRYDFLDLLLVKIFVQLAV